MQRALVRMMVGAAGIVLVCATASGCSSDDVGEAAASTPTDGSAPAAASPVALELGDCVRMVQAGGPDGSSLEQAPCDGKHHGEVVLASDQFFAADEQLPDEDRLQQLADTACAEAMSAYSGKPLQETPFRMSYLYPTESTWANGDRKLTCVAVAYDAEFDSFAEVTGSIRGAG